MNTIITKFLDFLTSENAPSGDKDLVIQETLKKFNLILDRKIYYCNYFAVRFSFTKSASSFSNTVLSLSALQKYDTIPVFIVRIVAKGKNLIYLANSTFITKISHSSQQLTMNNIKGSFNGSDICKSYHGLENCPDNFEKLFSYHCGLSWHDNLERLVAATGKIVGTGEKYEPNAEARSNILGSVNRAIEFCKSDDFFILAKDLEDRMYFRKDAICAASRIENVNIRGRLIEYIITNAYDEMLSNNLRDIELSETHSLTHNDLGDYHRTFEHTAECIRYDSYTDIKTKVIYLGSNPKAYNIDKFLECMGLPNTIFLFFFVGIDETDIVSKKLCPVYDKKLIEATVCQFHWAGRNSRGVTQLKGEDIMQILAPEYKIEIDIDKATFFVNELLNK